MRRALRGVTRQHPREQAEALHNESQTNQRDGCALPGKQCAFCREKYARVIEVRHNTILCGCASDAGTAANEQFLARDVLNINDFPKLVQMTKADSVKSERDYAFTLIKSLS